MRKVYSHNTAMDPSGFVLLSDYVPHVIQAIRYYSTYNFICERIDGYEEPYPDTYFEFPVSSEYLRR